MEGGGGRTGGPTILCEIYLQTNLIKSENEFNSTSMNLGKMLRKKTLKWIK